MKTSTQIAGISQTAIALAVLAAFNPAQAQTPPNLDTPTNAISIGIGVASGDTKDRAQFGIFNGLREHDSNLLLDFDYRSVADPAGFWMKFEGRNLGLDNRELRGTIEKQGDWKIGAEYNEITKHSPYTINTGMIGAGSTTPTVVRLAAPGTGSDVDLKTERKAASVSVQKWFSTGLLFEASFKSEDKDGARLWGRGYDCNAAVCGSSTATAINQTAFVKNALLLLPEPINSNIKQVEAKFTFHDEKLAATAGYYGSIYTNSNGNLTPTVPGSLNNAVGNSFPLYPAVTAAIIPGGGMSLQQVLQTPMALQPDNQAHQLYVSGNYAFAPATKATFKYAYTHATQNESFDSQGLGGYPAGQSSLNGRVDSTLAQIGLTSRPLDKLSLLANWRYERKEDRTPFAQYNVEGVGANPSTLNAGTNAPQTYTNSFWNNGHITRTTVNGKLEASYRLPADYRATVGLDYSSLERSVPEDIKEEKTAGITAVRERNWETGYRLELMKNMSETLTGRISYLNSERRGSDWTSLSTLDPATPGISVANLALINTYCGGRACYGQALPAASIVALSSTVIFPMQMTDVNREKWKMSASWNPTDRLTLQFNFEDGKDKTAAANDPIAGGKGWRDTDLRFYGIDASFALSDNWRLTGYASRGDSTLHVNHSTGYIADLNTISDAFGLGLTGKVGERFQLGANLAYFSDVNKYGFVASSSATGAPPSATNAAQAAIGLPDVSLKKTTVNLFGNYSLSKGADIRVDLVHQRAKLDEWVWGYNGVPFTYADNTTVTQQQSQSVTFVGARYIYKFR
jgi:MtrB/PioB family decaheme-associated outer membrane protein